MSTKRAPDMADFAAWMVDVHAHARALDREGEGRDWNAMAAGFLLARGVDHRVATDWELCSAFNCGDRLRAKAALVETERVWFAHDWADRCSYLKAYREDFVAAVAANPAPAGVGAAGWVRTIDDDAWQAASTAPKGRARAKAARAHLRKHADAGRMAQLAQIDRERQQRTIAGWVSAGTPLPQCAASGCLCNPHDRGYPTTTPCAELRMFDPNASKDGTP